MTGIRALGDRPLNRHELQQLLGYVYMAERANPSLVRKNITKARHARIKQFINREFVARMAEEVV